MKEFEIREWLKQAMIYEVILPEQLEELEIMIKEEMNKAKYYTYSGWTIDNFKMLADDFDLQYENFSDDRIKEIMVDHFEDNIDTEQQSDLLVEIVFDYCSESND